MKLPVVRAASRRRFLQYLAASPLFASGTFPALGAGAPSKLPDPMIWAPVICTYDLGQKQVTSVVITPN
jgi:4-hydroxymandelate oxidase